MRRIPRALSTFSVITVLCLLAGCGTPGALIEVEAVAVID